METVATLHKTHRKCLIRSEAAIRRHPHEFSEIRKILNRVVLESVDIDAYYSLAERLVALMEVMGPGTIFTQYFLDNIDPKRGCQARYFRFMCLDLRSQISLLVRRTERPHRLRLISSFGEAVQQGE